MLTQDMALLLYRISIAIAYRIWDDSIIRCARLLVKKTRTIYVFIFIIEQATARRSCNAAAAQFSLRFAAVLGWAQKRMKKSVKKCWQGGGGVVLYLSAKRWGKRMTSEATAGSPWKEPIDAEKFRFVLRNFLSVQVQKVQKLLKNKAWQKTTSVVQ